MLYTVYWYKWHIDTLAPLFKVIREKKGQVHVREFLLQKDFFLQKSAIIFIHCAKEEAKDDICMIEVVICYLV